MYLAGGTGFNHQAGFRAQPGTYQVMVYRGCRQQGRDGNVVDIDTTVGQDQDVETVTDRLFRLLADGLQCGFHTVCGLFRRVTDRNCLCPKGTGSVVFNMTDALDISVGQDRLTDFKPHVFTGGFMPQQIGARADQGDQRHHQFFTDRVNGWIGDLGEVLLEIICQWFGLV